MFQFSEKINRDNYFRFDKNWIENMNWATLPLASKALLPAIAIHCNGKGEAYPGETTIAILSGLSNKTVRSGIKALLGFPGFNLSRYLTAQGRRAKKFKMEFPPANTTKRYFPFHQCILTGGNWMQLKSASQALYPVMRSYSFFDKELYSELEEEEFDPMEFKEFYKNRKWDLCKAEVKTMALTAGITERAVYKSLKDLEEHSLIEDLNYDEENCRRWKVYLIPPKYYKRAYLNREIMKRHRSEQITGQ